MTPEWKRKLTIYVDRANGRWVVRDRDGDYWVLPPSRTPWDDRQPFSTADERDLETVPGHYRYLLGLPT